MGRFRPVAARRRPLIYLMLGRKVRGRCGRPPLLHCGLNHTVSPSSDARGLESAGVQKPF